MKSKKMRLNGKDIVKKLEEQREELHRFKVKRIGLFGSFQRGKQTQRSDLDFLVTFDKPTFDDYMELKFFLEETFGRKVDLVMEDALKPALKYVKEKARYAKGL